MIYVLDLNLVLILNLIAKSKVPSSCQPEEPKEISVDIFEYIFASMLKVFLDM